jgi:hypothetical protein
VGDFGDDDNDFGTPHLQDRWSNLREWRMCTELGVAQAALLLADADPCKHLTGEGVRNPPRAYSAAVTAISNGLQRGEIEGRIVRYSEYVNGELRVSERSIDTHESKVDVESLRRFLGARGAIDNFFFSVWFPSFARESNTSLQPQKPDDENQPTAPYLDPTHPRYAPKLAAAVEAWLAYEADSVSNRKPKKWIENWVRNRAAKYGLLIHDKPNAQGVEEIAKVANWEPTGGAPKTVRGNPPTP